MTPDELLTPEEVAVDLAHAIAAAEERHEDIVPVLARAIREDRAQLQAEKLPSTVVAVLDAGLRMVPPSWRDTSPSAGTARLTAWVARAATRPGRRSGGGRSPPAPCGWSPVVVEHHAPLDPLGVTMALEFDWCGRCNGPMWRGRVRHHCPPQWEVWVPNDGDREGAVRVFAVDAEDAAETWAHQEDGPGEHEIIDGEQTVNVSVSVVGSTAVSTWRVTGEMVPAYRAEEIARDDADGDQPDFAAEEEPDA